MWMSNVYKKFKQERDKKTKKRQVWETTNKSKGNETKADKSQNESVRRGQTVGEFNACYFLCAQMSDLSTTWSKKMN